MFIICSLAFNRYGFAVYKTRNGEFSPKYKHTLFLYRARSQHITINNFNIFHPAISENDIIITHLLIYFFALARSIPNNLLFMVMFVIFILHRQTHTHKNTVEIIKQYNSHLVYRTNTLLLIVIIIIIIMNAHERFSLCSVTHIFGLSDYLTRSSQ